VNGAYLVRSYPNGFLRLDGPFAYPTWVSDAANASPMSYALAHSWASAYGGEVARFGG
jgi:hypothetical protein